MRIKNTASVPKGFFIGQVRYQLTPGEVITFPDTDFPVLKEIVKGSPGLSLELEDEEVIQELGNPGGTTEEQVTELIDESLEQHTEDQDAHPVYLKNRPDVLSAGLWVAPASQGGNDSTGTGSFNKPFASFSRALQRIIDEPGTVNNPTIFLSPGEYTIGTITLDGTAVPKLANGLTVVGYGNTDSTPVKLNGGFILQGNITRVRLKDFQLSQPTPGEYSLHVIGTQGRHYFDNVTMNGALGIRYSGAYQRWSEFNNCALSPALVLGDGSCLANSSVRLRGHSDWGCAVTVGDTNMRLDLHNTYRIGKITHTAGKLNISRLDEIRSSDAEAITSTASGVNDSLIMNHVNLRRWDTNVFGILNKSGSCPHDLFSINRNAGADTVNGSAL